MQSNVGACENLGEQGELILITLKASDECVAHVISKRNSTLRGLKSDVGLGHSQYRER